MLGDVAGFSGSSPASAALLANNGLTPFTGAADAGRSTVPDAGMLPFSLRRW